jgi:hypothetical protein
MASRTGQRTSFLKSWRFPALAGVLIAFGAVTGATHAAGASPRPRTASAARDGFTIVPSHVAGNLDCNGYSTIQKTIIPPLACTTIRGSNVSTPFVSNGHFDDNGHDVGNDEADVTFFSDQAGSGENVNWSETLPAEPTLPVAVGTPGKDPTHWFELSAAPSFGMALCDGASYPQRPCTPESDTNAPSCFGTACPQGSDPGGGSADLEVQFYPPGDAPFIDAVSCSARQWCAALHVNEVECTVGFLKCNAQCEETTNFAFVQRNGVPTGPPSPQLSDDATSEPNSETLLMNPGDKLQVRIVDAPARAVPSAGVAAGHAVEVSIDDLTTGQSGLMQASAFNGFAQTSIDDCDGQLFNFQPEYSTAKVGNIVPWAALQSDIGTSYEIGRFTPCTSVNTVGGDGAGGSKDPFEKHCIGPYQSKPDGTTPEDDSPCWTKGDPHGTLETTGAPIAGCLDVTDGDLEFEGSSYRTDWPTGPTPTSTTAASFVQSTPTTNGSSPYPRFMFQADVALSEQDCNVVTGSGCTMPPSGTYVDQPGHTAFYPFWTVVNTGTCTLEFGNVTLVDGADDFGGDAQYGTVMSKQLGYPELEGDIYDNTCPAQLSQGYLLSGQSGQVLSEGDAPAFPSVQTPASRVVGIEATTSGKGYFAVTADGAVATAGDAAFHGDLGTLSPPVKVSDIVAIAPTTDDRGYWLIGADGGEFAFGDAKYHGSLPGLDIHVDDVIGMVAAPSGAGYLIVGADGGVFAFGATHFYGSLPGIGVHVTDIRGILPAAAGTGYILVGADGGAFSFGHGAPYHGSLPGEDIPVSDIVGIALTSDDEGYWMAGADGHTYAFGDAEFITNNITSADLPITAITNVLTDLAEVGP